MYIFENTNEFLGRHAPNKKDIDVEGSFFSNNFAWNWLEEYAESRKIIRRYRRIQGFLH